VSFTKKNIFHEQIQKLRALDSISMIALMFLPYKFLKILIVRDRKAYLLSQNLCRARSRLGFFDVFCKALQHSLDRLE
jgi:hypothetical protein